MANAAASGRRLAYVAAAVVAIVAVDQLTKVWATGRLAEGPISVIGGTLEFRLSRNAGSAFSLFQSVTPLLAVVALVVAVILFRAVRNATDTWMVMALTLILGGAVGNLIDRMFRTPGFLRGKVIDFVHLSHWPVFNVADAAITVGAVVLFVRAIFPPKDDVAGETPVSTDSPPG